MVVNTHDYTVKVEWTGNRGTGTSAYRAYDRNWDLATLGKPMVHCSNDPLLGGNPEKHNPEDMLIAALSSCHMLWYLHLCSEAGVIVTSYQDNPVAVGEVEPSGKGRFLSATLKPRIEITADSDLEKAAQLHDEIHQYCFVARSVNFPVTYEPEIIQT
ncbi:MAG: OsmC family protein [Rhizobiaceae bacterium]|nr:OsmC family protein [Rhizobiaceae bacterium]